MRELVARRPVHIRVQFWYVKVSSVVSMANHKSAEKRHKQSLVRRQRNRLVKTTVRTAVKKARAAIVEASAEKGARIVQAERELAKAAAKGVLHKKTAARLISRLAKQASAQNAAE